jgi:hypothetical protein
MSFFRIFANPHSDKSSQDKSTAYDALIDTVLDKKKPSEQRINAMKTLFNSDSAFSKELRQKLNEAMFNLREQFGHDGTATDAWNFFSGASEYSELAFKRVLTQLDKGELLLQGFDNSQPILCNKTLS